MPAIQDLLTRIDSLKAELDALRPLDRELEERVLQKFRLWWTYHSNAIEGNKLTQGETEMFLMEGLTAKGKPLKDHLDLRGHSNAINYLLAFIREKDVLTEAVIRKLHEVLLVESYQVPAISPDGVATTKTVALGQYKTLPNHVRTPTGETHYYATPLETPAKMQALVDWQRAESEKQSLHAVEIASRFHHEFTAIHPFDDGNGRMARLLMNLSLMQKGFPPVVIRIGERDAYLFALREADAGDAEGFVQFIAERVAGSLELFLRAARGEEIHEPTDLEKEIALLKLELQHIEEPMPLTQALQIAVFERSVDPLFSELKRLLVPLSELFSKALIRLPSGEQFELATQTEFPRPRGCWAGENTIHQLDASFELIGFKKGGLNPFDVSTDLRLRFEPLRYSISFAPPSGEIKVAHFHQEQLTADEAARFTQEFARYFLETTRKKTSATAA